MRAVSLCLDNGVISTDGLYSAIYTSLFDGENQTEVVLTFHLQPVDFHLLNPSSTFHVGASLSSVERSSGFLQWEVTLTSVGYS